MKTILNVIFKAIKSFVEIFVEIFIKNIIIKRTLPALYEFFSIKRNRRLSYLVVIGLIALGDFLISGLARRTFVFYSDIEGNTIVEDRMIHKSRDRETDIRRYLEEVLLGPVTPDAVPLFPRETRLNSFMYRDGVVYVNLTESAALPLAERDLLRPLEGPGSAARRKRGVPEEGEVYRSLLTLNEGLRRNFSYIHDVRLFIGGNEVFFEEFRGFFAKSADNRKTAP
ncbi:MAG: GerMN domain-containing protein [Treponema sp.]|nr:GerMN domain-containing protein [Treponema sp.]